MRRPKCRKSVSTLLRSAAETSHHQHIAPRKLNRTKCHKNTHAASSQYGGSDSPPIIRSSTSCAFSPATSLRSAASSLCSALTTSESPFDAVRAAPEPVVVADDANCIVAVSSAAAELLLWPAEELVGHRVTVIVPPRLREAHIAGFTRQLMTGQGRLIGHELEVPALRRDGSEVAVMLRLTRQDVGDRTLFVAGLLPPASRT